MIKIYLIAARSVAFSSLVMLAATGPLHGQEAPPAVNKPILRLEAGGPTSNITSLAFSPDGETLYAAGFDKVVRVWGRDPKTGRFELDEKRYFRVPINPGTEGSINAMALSPDGEWLAVGGRGMTRVSAGFFKAAGRVWPVVGRTPELRYDQGQIYVFSTRRQDVRLLRGHSGEIISLAFVPAAAGQMPLLASAARGWDFEAKKVAGEVRVWDVAKEQQLGEWVDLPPPPEGGLLPGLAPVRTGPKPNQVRVVVAWGDQHQGAAGPLGYLRILDLDGPKGHVQKLEDGYHNTALALMPDGKSLWGGSFADGQGQARLWDVTANPPAVTRRLALTATNPSFYFPDRLASFGLSDDGPPDHLAVLVRQMTKVDSKWAEENRLHLVDELGQTKAAVPLWKNMLIAPALAVSTRGRAIAVAGHKDHAIRVFAIPDLLRGQAEPQILHSAGATIRQVAFATRTEKGQTRLGLLMNEASGKA
ncbi:MAG TPA: hypothetical protein VGX76_03270, partial [Pirellulales bacterium]|nr:hypothetical protein [Pirellulales bacterium]